MNHPQRILGTVAIASLPMVGILNVVSTPAGASPVVTCGQTITTSTVLTNDVGPCSTIAGLTLAGSNITLNLNGHRVFGNGDPTIAQFGVHLFNSPGDIVENGQVYGFATGVYLERSTNDTVKHMFLHDNVGPRDGSGDFGEGLQIFQGGGHMISHNQVIHNGTFAGIDSYSSSNNTFASNVVENNNIIQENAQHLGPTVMQDIGIWVLNLNPSNPAGATNNAVRANDVVNNGLDGIQIGRYTDANRVLDNQVVHNGFGQVKGIRDGDGVANFGNNNMIRGNTSVVNAANGIRVVASSSGGVPVGGQDNTITGNQAFGNGTGINSVGTAFDLTDTNVAPPCDANTWLANAFLTVNQPCVAAHG